MTVDKRKRDRVLPIVFNINEQFDRLCQDCFFMALITQGYVVLRINGETCCLRERTLLCLTKYDRVEFVASYRQQAISLSFSPEFMNVNLNWDTVMSSDYPELCGEFDYPAFDLFLRRNTVYKGVLPVDGELAEKVEDDLKVTFHQLSEQPDSKWSCRARTHIFILFEMLEHFQSEFMKGGIRQDGLASAVLDYIHLNICKPASLGKVCELFHTNHMTLNRKFKALTGFTVTDYTLEKRTVLARRVLAFSELSIEEISYIFEFNGIPYFTLMFKKRVNISPMKYRKKMREMRRNIND